MRTRVYQRWLWSFPQEGAMYRYRVEQYRVWVRR
jgi:hypothetical protein